MLRVHRIDVYVDKWNLRTAETSSAKTCLERFKPRNVSARSSICDAMISTVRFLFSTASLVSQASRHSLQSCSS